MRLDKFLSHNGFGTRKEVKLLIKKKQVEINGTIITDAGFILDPSKDKVVCQDQMIEYVEDVYIMMNKPQGYICEHNPKDYPSVLELLNMHRNDLFFVGRLDADTEGLLLITNDGQFSHSIAHGKKEVTKQYEVHLEKDFDETFIKDLHDGIPMDDSILKTAEIQIIEPRLILLTISEGKYHQVKRMMHHCDNQVVHLKRLKIGELELDKSLELGDYRFLTQEEINQFT